MADFYKALSEGVSEDELRKIFEDELAAAKKQINEDQRKENIANYRGYLIEDFFNYLEALTNEKIPDDDYDRLYNMVEELFKPFEDFITSIDFQHLTNAELEKMINELLNK